MDKKSSNWRDKSADKNEASGYHNWRNMNSSGSFNMSRRYERFNKREESEGRSPPHLISRNSRFSGRENDSRSKNVRCTVKPIVYQETADFTNLAFLKTLLSDHNCDALVLILSGHIEQYSDVFTKKLNHELLKMIIEINSSICSSNLVIKKCQILQATLNEEFKTAVNNAVSTVILETVKEPQWWTNLEEDWLKILVIFEESLNLIPSKSWCVIQGTLKLLQINSALIENEKGIAYSDAFKEKLSRLAAKVEIHEKRYPGRNRKTKNDVDEELEPEDDYRFMDIFPRTKELVTRERNFIRKNLVVGSYKSIAHYLDVSFRLLREDFLNPIREDLHDYVTHVNRRFFNIKVFDEVRFSRETYNKDDTCFPLKIKMNSGLENWFKSKSTKRFLPGTLLLFSENEFDTIFCGTVANCDNLAMGQLSVSFKRELPKLNRSYKMVECIIYFEPYYNVLNVLQTLCQDALPMEKYLINVETSIERPKYLPSASRVELMVKKDIVGLNSSQQKALIGALSQEFVVIQGPPGTGKTFLGLKITKQLLRCNSGPILVVCYTNHALDQFLEGLLPFTKCLVRLGAQSKSEKLKKHSLYEMKRLLKTGSLCIGDKKDDLSRCAGELDRIQWLIDWLEAPDGIFDFEVIRKHVRSIKNSCFSHFTNEDLVVWLLQDTSKSQDMAADEIDNLYYISRNYLFNYCGLTEFVMENCLHDIQMSLKGLQQWIEECKVMLSKGELPQEEYEYYVTCYENDIQAFRMDYELITEKREFIKTRLNTKYELDEEEIVVDDPFALQSEIRWKIYNVWLQRTKPALELKKIAYLRGYRIRYEWYEYDRSVETVNTLKKVSVIGMTTSCAAKMHDVLERVGCQIVIVEEAAEVLEAHILTVLTNSCKHLILLGDHQQLKPSTADYVVEKDYQLGISLFERMVKNNIQCYTLNVQHRMRPEISSLISPVIYPNLENHESVHEYPHIKGVSRSVYFIDHCHEEENFGDSSKCNMFEARYLLKLAEYLVKVGYRPQDITILTGYTGQVFTMQNELKYYSPLIQLVQITPVDNFQGEENKIILLSLVRNNVTENVGFLRTENRICVALSRAKQGLYIMGNMTQLCGSSKIWQSIKETLESQNAIGNSLPLTCQDHNTITLVRDVEDFQKVPEGGCEKNCSILMRCGHGCKRKCHQDDSHSRCTEPCLKNICPIPLHNIICDKLCWESCNPCSFQVNVTLDCGHDQQVPCYKKNVLKRENRITSWRSLLDKGRRHDSEIKCTYEENVDLPCGHQVVVNVCNKYEIEKLKCTFKENITLPCGHQNEKLCGEDAKCSLPCSTVLLCGHICTDKCHATRDPDHLKYKCNEEVRKENLRCSKFNEKHFSILPCSQTANYCRVKVTKMRKLCLHRLDVDCFENVNQLDCNKTCKKILPCRHRCPNSCSSACGPCKQEVTVKASCEHWLKTICGQRPDPSKCKRRCEKALPCGHQCRHTCGEACSTLCYSTCDKKLECGHICINMCRDEQCACIHKVGAECGHEIPVKCTEEPVKENCKKRCQTLLACGHVCRELCNQSCTSKCMGRTTKTLVCGHTLTKFCYLFDENTVCSRCSL